jgi:hypothetical protein
MKGEVKWIKRRKWFWKWNNRFTRGDLKNFRRWQKRQ